MITTPGATLPSSLDGVTAVVTGASRGIGEAIARSLAGAGATVALVARGRPALEQLASELGIRAHVVPCDLADAAAVARAVEQIGAVLGESPRIVVNNAGSFHLARAAEESADAFAATLNLNLVAPFRMARAFLPAMLAAGRGHLVTIGSIADRHSFPLNAAYAASNFGLRAVHEVLRAETQGTGVRASLVSPAATDTDSWTATRAGAAASSPTSEQMLRAEDVARAVLFVVSQPAHVTIDELRLSRS